MTGAEPVTDRRGGDSRARRNAAEMNRQSLKRQTPPTCHCEGASCPWQSREGTCSPYRPPSKRHAPIASVAALTAQPLAALPPYGCGVPFTGGERHAGWHYLRHKFIGARPPSLSFRGAKRRGNLLQPVTFSPRPTCYSTWYCEIAASACVLLAMTHQAVQRCTRALLRLNFPRTGRSLSAATDAIGLYVLSFSVRTDSAFPRLPRRLRLLAMTNPGASAFHSKFLYTTSSVRYTSIKHAEGCT